MDNGIPLSIFSHQLAKNSNGRPQAAIIFEPMKFLFSFSTNRCWPSAALKYMDFYACECTKCIYCPRFED